MPPVCVRCSSSDAGPIALEATGVTDRFTHHSRPDRPYTRYELRCPSCGRRTMSGLRDARRLYAARPAREARG